MPRFLRNLKIDDVSSVDRGAGRGVRVLLTKRDVSTEERERLADKGHALPDGSFPIANEADLKNAIRAIGRAKDPAKAKAHIKSRARALGRSDLIPEGWSKRDAQPDALQKLLDDMREGLIAKAAVDYDTAAADIEAAECAQALMCELREAICALDTSICSIFGDDDVADKAKAIDESFNQFKAHVAEFDFAGADHPDVEFDKADMTALDKFVAAKEQSSASNFLEKLLEPVEGFQFEKVEKSMAVQLPEKLQAVVDKAVAEAIAKAEVDKAHELKALKDELAKAKDEVVKLGMSERHKAYHDKLPVDEQKRFAAMTPAERDDHMDKAKKRYEEDPMFKSMREENEALRKRISRIEDERALELAKIEAKEMGMTQVNAGEIVMKMRRSCDEATYDVWKKHNEEMRLQNIALRKMSHAFEEIGDARGGSGAITALDELNAKRDELRKSKPELTEAQAFEKVLLDPANRELMLREKTERMQKINRMAV